jgi:DNA-binding NarL/FixJ family response regulator
MKITIGILEPLKFINKSMPLLFNQHEGFQVVVNEDNRLSFKNKITALITKPDIVLIDIHQPQNESVEAVYWIKKHCANTKMIAIGTEAKYIPILDICEAGCQAYFGLELDENIINKGIEQVYTNCFSSKQENYIDCLSILKAKTYNGCILAKLSILQRDALEYFCTSLTNKEISVLMKVALTTINFHVDELGRLFNVCGRKGLRSVSFKLGY